MATLFVRHTVSDYTAWRKIYDDFKATRTSLGVTSDGVYQSTDNPNDITIYHEFDSLEAAKKLLESTELREAMGRGGVVGVPETWITQRS